MKRILLTTLCLLGLLTIVNAQETTFSFNFNNNTFDGWTGIDADGDGHTWELHNTTTSGGMDGTYGLYSSCYNAGELTPDNYIFTSETYLITENSQLHFFHCQSDIIYFNENFGVIVSEDGINFLEIWSKKYTEPYPNDKWGEEFVDLSEYAGKNMYIGFRHHNCSGVDANGIRIDNVELTSVESVAENEISFNVYPNPVENQLLIETEKEITNITIFTVNGVMMYEGRYNKEGIDISGLNAGVYFVKIAIDNHEIIEKIIKK